MDNSITIKGNHDVLKTFYDQYSDEEKKFIHYDNGLFTAEYPFDEYEDDIKKFSAENKSAILTVTRIYNTHYRVEVICSLLKNGKELKTVYMDGDEYLHEYYSKGIEPLTYDYINRKIVINEPEE